jgi:uncharacterized Zn-finger protein
MAEMEDSPKEAASSKARKSPEDTKMMLDTPTSEPPKKRRRVVKPNAEKKFECKHEGCGKSYSRAEHLYRHQLNRKSRSILHCHWF